jgi:hypothetical protein
MPVMTAPWSSRERKLGAKTAALVAIIKQGHDQIGAVEDRQHRFGVDGLAEDATNVLIVPGDQALS